MERTIRNKNLEQDVLNQIKKDKIQAQKHELTEANKKKKKESNFAPSASLNSQQLTGLLQGGDPQNMKGTAAFNKRKQSAGSNISS